MGFTDYLYKKDMIALDQPNYKITGEIEAPLDIDYNIFGLHKSKTFVTGELRLVEYFKEFDGTTYSNLVVKEERAYTRNAWDLAEYRTQTSTWYLEDDTIGCTKVTTKYYNPQESMEEAEYRRTNLLSDAKLYTASVVGLPDALDFMKSVNTEISLYIQGEQDSLLVAIAASTKPYLDPTIKATLAAILTLTA